MGSKTKITPKFHSFQSQKFSQKDFCENFKNKVSERFQISSYGDLSWFLNIKIERTENEIKLSQAAFVEVEKMLEKINMSESKTLETPLDVSLKL